MSLLRAARFVLRYYRPSAELVSEEVRVPTADGEVEATLLRPLGGGPHPAWVVLHGITVPGRDHPVLQRFARALAASGSVVLLPDVPEWRALRIAPERAESIIAGATRLLARREEVERGGAGVIGFSFGATCALAAAAKPELARDLRSVVAFGGYCDLERTVAFQFTGRHEWRGQVQWLEPDPYGRWIVAANYLTEVSGLEGAAPVAEAARRLALEAGRVGAFAGDPVYEPLKASLRERILAEHRALYDLVAPALGTLPDSGSARSLARALAGAALRIQPELDPRAHLRSLDRPAVLAHGLDDRLIPYTETLRLGATLPPSARSHVAVTRLFAHSAAAERLPAWRFPLEAARYLGLLARALGS